MSGLKSHDNHVLIQQFLPIALRGSNLPSYMVRPLVDMSTFFRGICLTTLTLEDLNRFENDICITLCKMEQVFLPSFFTSMIHIVHLICEYCLSGLVQYRRMYLREINFDLNI
jgi:hypothetical protein